MGAPEITFGQRLRRLRLELGLTQEALADRAQLTTRAVAALESGARRRPYRRTAEMLADALGLSGTARAEFTELAHRSVRPTGWAGPPDSGAVPRLPVWPTSFLGREADARAIRALLDPDSSKVRLLSLLGPGGVGKTRLAVAATAELAPLYSDGVAFVDLAPLRDRRLVPATLARALGLREPAGQSAGELLLEHLQPRQVLLLLDNFEHLLSAAPLLAEVLQRCQRVALLITSRTALRLQAERRFNLRPLPTPDVQRATPAQVAASAAVRLFVERAQAVASDFELGPSNANTIAKLCQRLDGMPLAIELAAARSGLLQPAAMLQRLERGLPLLAHGAPDLPERQQTLHQTLAWSYGLLGTAEQALLRHLAVFAGGCTLEAIEAVCVLGGEGSGDMLDRLEALVDGSLIYRIVDADEGARFGMLQTVRDYAAERLAESGEREAIGQRHAIFYLGLAERVVPELSGPKQAAWLLRLEQEHANLHAALDWLSEQGDLDAALRLATAATWYWLHRGYFTDAGRLLRLLGATEGQHGAVRATALLAAARLASTRGEYAAQSRYDDESLRLYREVGDPAGAAAAVTDLGSASWQQGRLDEAELYLAEGLRFFRTLEEERAIGTHVGGGGIETDSLALALASPRMTISTPLLPLACVARDRGELAVARPLFAEALARRRSAGDQLGTAHVLNNLGWLELYAGNLAAARPLVEESLAIRRALRAPREAGVSQTLLGKIALVAQESGTAAAHFQDSLKVHRAVGNRWGIALALEGVAGLAAATQPEQALRLAAAASAVRVAIGRPLPPAEQPLLDGWLAPARQALSAEHAERAWADGWQLSEAQALATALELAASFATSE
jgi:predicted ATPase/transcriptional regulator with XRE-family HTH domain